MLSLRMLLVIYTCKWHLNLDSRSNYLSDCAMVANIMPLHSNARNFPLLSGATFNHRSWMTLVQLEAWCLTESSIYFKQNWRITSEMNIHFVSVRKSCYMYQYVVNNRSNALPISYELSLGNMAKSEHIWGEASSATINQSWSLFSIKAIFNI